MTKVYGLLQWASGVAAVTAMLLGLAALTPGVRADEPPDPGNPPFGGNAGPCDVTCSTSFARCNGKCDKIKPDCNNHYCIRITTVAVDWCECKV